MPGRRCSCGRCRRGPSHRRRGSPPPPPVVRLDGVYAHSSVACRTCLPLLLPLPLPLPLLLLLLLLPRLLPLGPAQRAMVLVVCRIGHGAVSCAVLKTWADMVDALHYYKTSAARRQRPALFESRQSLVVVGQEPPALQAIPPSPAMDHVDIAPVAGEAQSGRDRPRCAAVSSGQGQQGQPGKVRPVPELPSFLCSALALTAMVILSRIQALASTNNNKLQCFFSLPTRSTLYYRYSTGTCMDAIAK